MIPRSSDEELIAQTLADALRGKMNLSPGDLMRLGAAAREVNPKYVAGLALERWIRTDPRAVHILQFFISRL